MDRRALIVGIDHYDLDRIPNLNSCVEDARTIERLLSQHANGDANYDCRCIVSGGSRRVTRARLRKEWEGLFASFDGDILFYFSGHGKSSSTGGYFVTQDGSEYDPGLFMNEVISLANQSEARNVVLIIDCCHAGLTATFPGVTSRHDLSTIREGVTVLAGARGIENAFVENGKSIFTSLIVQALEGGASDIEGQVTTASVYSFVERLLGVWQQRPMYKSNSIRSLVLRNCRSLVTRSEIRELIRLFDTPEAEYQLDPQFEDYELEDPDSPRDEKNITIFRAGDREKNRTRALLKTCQIAGLLKPRDRTALFWAMMYSETAVLTDLGKFYWKAGK
ncbi:MAG: caspase family protein [Pseudomonadota bacterium]